MVIQQRKQIETLLNKNNIKKFFYNKNPKVDNNNSNETITREFDILFQEIDKEFPFMGLTSEEHTVQCRIHLNVRGMKLQQNIIVIQMIQHFIN